MKMKFLNLSVILFISLLIINCSKDETSDNPNNDNEVIDKGDTSDSGTDNDADNDTDTDTDTDTNTDTNTDTDTDTDDSYGLDPNAVPGKNFDLSYWNLSIPVAEADGTATDIRTTALIDDYENDTYFYTGEDGAMVFKNFIDGAKTSTGTDYTRSELREMIYGTDYDTQSGLSTKDNANNWFFSSSDQAIKDEAGGVGGELTATVKIDHVTTTGTKDYQIGRVIIGQIHASDDEPCRLYYRKLPNNTQGSIYFAHEPTNSSEQWHELIGSRSDSQSNSFDGVELGEIFSYSINVVENDLTVTIFREGKANVAKTVDMTSSGYANDYMYFKAGVYSQNNSGDPDDYDQVSFYELNVTH